jgi:hypothetical protein
MELEGGGTAVSNTDGSITSSVSANTTAGFSIVSYTGTWGCWCYDWSWIRLYQL